MLGTELSGFHLDLADPILHVVLVAMAVQWPLFVALRHAAYPISGCHCDLQEDITTEKIPMHLLKIWWAAKKKRILTSCNLEDAGAAVVGSLLEEDEAVTELKLTDNKIGPKGAESLFSALQANQHLTHLFLDGNPIGPDGLRLLPGLVTAQHKVQGSCVNFYRFLPDSSVFTSASTSTLQLLSLSRTQLGSQLHPLALFLSKTSALKQLYLNHNGLGETGAHVLAAGLRENSSLETLTLNENQVRGGILVILAALTIPHSQLATIYVAENHINNEHIEHVLSYLPQMPKLKKINLAKNSFSLHLLTEAAERGLKLPKLRVSAKDQSDKGAVQHLVKLGVDVEVDHQSL